MTTVDAPIPQNLEAEEAILGAMLMSASAIEAAHRVGVRASSFYRPSHRLIFDAVVELDADGAADELSVINLLKRRSKIDEVGGAAAVMTLVERVPAVANAKAYAQEVVDQATLRGLVTTGHEIARLGYEHPDEPTALINRAAELAAGIDAPGSEPDFVSLDDLLGPLYDEWTERAENGGELVGASTGFHHLDQRIGGLRDGTLTVVAGRPGMGKSAFAMNIAEHIAMDGGHVAVFNFEMDPSDIAGRVVSGMAKVEGQRLTSSAPRAEDWQPLSDAIQRIRERAPGRIRISPSPHLTPFQVRSRSRRLKRQLEREGKSLRLIVIDYLQLMELGKRAENRQAEVSAMSRQIKAMALELRVPVLLLSQLNRAVELRPDKRPMLSDLRESGAVEQDADAVLLLHRPEYYLGDDTPPEQRGLAEVITAKNRGGPPGTTWLAWLGKYTKFANLETSK